MVKGEDEIGVDRKTKKTIIQVDPRYYRPAEVETLLGDATKGSKEKLGEGNPEITFDELREGYGMKMKKTDKILIAGSNGMVGSAIVRSLKSAGYNNLVYGSRDYRLHKII